MRNKSSFLGSVKWGGVAAITSVLALVIAAVALWEQTWQMNRPEVTGVVKLERILAASILAPEYLTASEITSASVSINGESVASGHLQLRMYLVSNTTGRHIAPSDFDAPITAQAMNGWKILSVDVIQPANRPSVKTEAVSDKVVIPPLLLNAGEMSFIKVLIASRDPLPLITDPYVNDDGVLRWTAEIKGAKLQVTGAERPTSNWLDTNVPGIYFLHKGLAIIALIVIALLSSLIQLGAVAWHHRRVSLTFWKSMEIAGRLALAWATAEVLVSFADTMFATSYWVNWSMLVLFAVSLVPVKSSWVLTLFRRTPPPDAPA